MSQPAAKPGLFQRLAETQREPLSFTLDGRELQALAGDKAAARASFKEALKGEPGNADFKAALAAL